MCALASNFLSAKPTITALYSAAGRLYRVELADSCKALELLSRSTRKIAPDKLTGLDLVGKLTSKMLRDSYRASDSSTATLIRSLVDGLRATDLIQKRATKVLREVVYHDMDWAAFRSMVVSDVLKALDQVSYFSRRFRSYADGLRAIDQTARRALKALSDSYVCVDSLTKSTRKVALDRPIASDLVVKRAFKALSDSSALREVLSKSARKVTIDRTIASDLALKVATKALVDVVYHDVDWARIGLRILLDVFSALDQVSYFSRKFRSYADGLRATDLALKGASKVLRDSGALYEAMVRSTSKVAFDRTIAYDVVAKFTSRLRSFVDGLVAADVVSRLALKVLVDVGVAVDYMCKLGVVDLIDFLVGEHHVVRLLPRVVVDVASVVDGVSKLVSLSRFDLLRALEQVLRSRLVVVSDAMIGELWIAKRAAQSVFDLVRSRDLTVKPAFTIAGLMFWKRFAGDLIAPEDHNYKVDASKVLLTLMETLKSALGADGVDLSFLSGLVSSMKYVSEGDQVLSEHYNVFVDYCRSAIDVVERLYEVFTSKVGIRSTLIEVNLNRAKLSASLLYKVSSGDVVLSMHHNIVIEILKALELALIYMVSRL